MRSAAFACSRSVEELTGGKVIGFVIGTDTGRDISAEIFYLEPVPTPVK